MKDMYEFPESFYDDESDIDIFDDEPIILNDAGYLGPDDFGDD